jgi:hypothetical protein
MIIETHNEFILNTITINNLQLTKTLNSIVENLCVI